MNRATSFRWARLRAEVRSLAYNAMATLRELVSGPDVPPSVRLRASLAIIQAADALTSKQSGRRRRMESKPRWIASGSLNRSEVDPSGRAGSWYDLTRGANQLEMLPNPGKRPTMPAEPVPRPWRRYLRFSVRGIIVVVLVVGGWLGCLSAAAKSNATPL